MTIRRKILLGVLIIIFIASALLLISYALGGHLFARIKDNPDYTWQDIEIYCADILEDQTEKNIWEIDKMTTADMVVMDKYADLYGQNEDIIGWLTIEGTLIDYPVMQTKDDPEFYLDHGFDGNYLYQGTLFMDAKSDLDQSANFIIYGHNMSNGNMFGQLSRYKDESFYQDHPSFRFDTIYKEANYQVIAVFLSRIYLKSDDVFKYYQWGLIDNEADFAYYVHHIQAMSLYDTGETASWGDQLLTLSTCYYHTDHGRFVVVAKKITE